MFLFHYKVNGFVTKKICVGIQYFGQGSNNDIAGLTNLCIRITRTQYGNVVAKTHQLVVQISGGMCDGIQQWL